MKYSGISGFAPSRFAAPTKTMAPMRLPAGNLSSLPIKPPTMASIIVNVTLYNVVTFLFSCYRLINPAKVVYSGLFYDFDGVIVYLHAFEKVGIVFLSPLNIWLRLLYHNS
ncbi:hypothetical protein [Thermovenabulum sp.]|uniref:hypothetical protein n=1 Tax=Thermovenabulum sp. TaxID=3100335 RepID=UPI003C7CF3A0